MLSCILLQCGGRYHVLQHLSENIFYQLPDLRFIDIDIKVLIVCRWIVAQFRIQLQTTNYCGLTTINTKGLFILTSEIVPDYATD